MSRGLIVAAAGIAALLSLTAPALPAAGPAAAEQTRIVVYSPFAIDGGLATGVHVVRSVSGSCWTASAASRRSDAWRCITGNEIHDPCYSGLGFRWVVCPLTPSGGKVLRLTISRPLPQDGNQPLDTRKSDPARIVLRGGVSCSLSTGATGAVAGLRVAYGCSNGAWLLGSPDRSSPLWHILYLRSSKASQATSVPIVVAWW